MKGRRISTVLFAGAFLGVSADFAAADGGSWRAVRSMVSERHREGAAGQSHARSGGASSLDDSRGESVERMAAASGHYARARALLIEALAEFERGQKIARPDLLINPDQWRGSVISRKDELDKLLNPQPRVSRIGARFVENPELLREPKEGYVPPHHSTDHGSASSRSLSQSHSSSHSASHRAGEPLSATSGRGQLRGISPADAVPATAPDRASKLKLGEDSKEATRPVIRAPQVPVKKEQPKKTSFEEVPTKRATSVQEATAKKDVEVKNEEEKRAVADASSSQATTPTAGQPQSEGKSVSTEKSKSDKAPLVSEVMETRSEKVQAEKEQDEPEAAKSLTSPQELKAKEAPVAEQKPRAVEEKPALKGEAVKGSDETIGEQSSVKAAPEGKEAAVQSEEDPATTKAIQDALIQERLKRLTEEIAAEERRQKGN